MPRTNLIPVFSAILFLSTVGPAQQTQENNGAQQSETGQPARPSPSIYNRMRRMGGGEMGLPSENGQGQPQVQSQQLPNAQQFPPEQQGAVMPGQRAPMHFPHVTQPPNQQPTQPQANQPQNQPGGQIVPPGQQIPQPQPQVPTGQALKPPNPPRVTYTAGALTVIADNSQLSDILSAVDRAIGSRIEGTRPDSERVFGKFGPGSPRDVLNALLSGSLYDFILVGAIDDPGGVQRIMLSPHGTAPTTVAGNQNPSASQEEENEAVVPEPEPPQPLMRPDIPSEQVQQPPPPQMQQQPQQQVKTPEQLLEELQRLRQQQQQQQGSNPREY